MTELDKLNQQLLEYYHQIEVIFGQGQRKLGLNCPAGCGVCCLNPDVTATVLEMLPFASSLFKYRQADQVYESLNGTPQKNCHFYRKETPDGEMGKCSIYPLRPILCRIFAAFPRHGKKHIELSVCKKIKQESQSEYQAALESLKKLDFAMEAFPPTWKLKVMGLRPDLGTIEYPINIATLQAITFAAPYFREQGE